MENKYRSNSYNPFEGGWSLVHNTDNVFIADFKYLKDSEEYVKFKNQPKIDKGVKYELIQEIETRMEFNKDADHVKKYKYAIEIISNLPTEEN